MNLRSLLNNGALALSIMVGALSNNGCATGTRYTTKREHLKPEIERTSHIVTDYKITDASISNNHENPRTLKIAVDKEVIEEGYEREIRKFIENKYAQEWEEVGTGKMLAASIFWPPSLLGAAIDPKSWSKAWDEKKYGEEELIESKVIDLKKTEFKKVGEKTIENEKAGLTPIVIYADKLLLNNQKDSLETKTREDGLQEIEIRIPPQTERLIFLDKEDIKRTKWDGVKVTAMDYISEYLFNETKEEKKEYKIEIKTNAEGARRNDRKNITTTVERWVVKDDALDNAVRSFVRKELNPHIRRITISLQDIESHTPITETGPSKDEIKPGNIYINPIEVPSRKRLIGEYFEEKFADSALNELDGYIDSKIEKETDKKANVSIAVYIPSIVEIKITHPRYHFVPKQEIKFSEESLDKVVYMSKIGNKVDLKIVDKKPESKIKEKD